MNARHAGSPHPVLRCLPERESVRPVVRNIARLAVRSLHQELVIYPKPGLVSRHDNGAHDDMDAAAFLRSLFALRRYFADIALAGAQAAPMAELRRLGLSAEARMLHATNGINTHRGAIFALGLLCATAGRAWAERRSFSDATLRETLGRCWRRELLLAPTAQTPSHGQQVAARYAVSGARGEAIGGFPAVFEIALPALRDALARGASAETACLHAFFALLARVADTNVLYRGGDAALRALQADAEDFLAAGSVFGVHWLHRAQSLHLKYSQRRISPGGCADLLAAAWFVHQLQNPMP